MKRSTKRKIERALSMASVVAAAFMMLYGFMADALIGEVNGWNVGRLMFGIGFIWVSFWTCAQVRTSGRKNKD